MKKRFSVVFAIFAASIMAISLVGCSGKDDTVQCEHDWIAATCTQPELCSKCGETRGEAAGHKYVYTTIDATCDDAGSKNGECSVCHDKTTVYLPQLSHKYVSAVEEGDCETDTVTTYTCELCKDAYSEVTKRHVGHDTTNVKWTFKSEAQDGAQCEYLVTETAKCNTCKKDIERTYHKHVAKWEVDDIEYSTCKDEGAVYYVCACGNEQYAKTEVLPVTPAAHIWSASNKAGITHECEECGATKSEVVISGNSATLSAAQLSGENISIKTEAEVTLQPDTALAGKMAGGVDIAATPVNKDELPTVNQEIAEKLENAPIYNFELKNNAGNAIDFDGGKMTITVPYELSYGEDPTTVAVLYIDASGNEHVVDAVYGNGSATFTVEHFSHYAVVRLTAAERCALLGHNYNVMNFAATCTEDGFTVKSCNRCGDFVREDGEKKLGHDYKATVVPATCTEKGYTLMTCSRTDCDDSYVTSYTAILAHDYAETVVSPTCTAKGYTIHTCKNCGHSYRDSYTDMIAHNFIGNECTVCHKKNDAAADSNFYLNLVNSLGNVTDGYYLEIHNAKFEIKATYGEDGKHVETSKGEIETYKLQVALDADGYLVGSGEGRMTFSATSSEQEAGGTQKILLAFKNKNIYISINQTNIDEYGKTVYENNMVMSQDEASLDQIKAFVAAYYTDELKAAVSKLMNNQSENNPVNAALAKVCESVFDRTETESGYALTLNYDKIAKLVAFVNEHNCQEVFDAVFGEGEFASLMKFVKELPEMKFNDFVNKLVSKAEVYGLTQSDIYGIIDSLMTKVSNGNQFDFAEFVQNYNSKTVPEMVELLSDGEMTAEEVGEMITGMVEAYEPMLTNKEISLVDFVCGMVAEDEMAELVAGIKEFALSTLDALLEVAEHSLQVVVNTDASGAFSSASVAAKDFAFDLEIPDPLVPSGAKVEVTAEISLNIATGSGAIGDNNNIVVATDNARKSFVNIIKNDKGSPIDSELQTKYQIVKYQGEYLLVPILVPDRYILNSGNLSEPREEVYNGTNCMAVDYLSWNSSYILDLEGNEYSYTKSCSGWTENDVSAQYIHYTIYTLYIDNDGYQLLGYELNAEATMEFREKSSYTRTIYTNATQGKISLSTPHKYTLIEEKKPATCEETGYRKYRCTVCGEIQVRNYSIGHDYESTYRLKDEKLGCAGGVLEVATCTRCNKEFTREMDDVIYEDGRHRTFRMSYPIADAKCPNTHVEMYSCVCGEYIDYIDVNGGCEFKRISEVFCEKKGENGCEHGYSHHYITTYQCAVTACAYTYTREERFSFPDENCVATIATVYKLQDGTEYSMTRKELQHSDTSTTETTEGGLTVRTQYCGKCNQTVRIDKYDTYDRWVYYFDAIEKTGWEKVYEDGSCYGRAFNLDKNGMRSGEPTREGFDHKETRDVEQKTSCTQVHRETWTCLVCHNDVNVTDYYYGHHFQYDTELEKTVCIDCGMTNSIYADGPVVLENLSKKLGGFKIGFTHYRDILDISFYADYDMNTGYGTPIDGINYDQNYTGARCGIIVIDTNAVSAWLEQNAESTFTVVFETRARKDYKDEYPDYLEISLTFTAEELAEILGI